MLGKILLGVLLFIEIGFIALELVKKFNFKKEKAYTRITLFALFIILVLSGIIKWGFQIYSLMILFTIQAILGVVLIARKKQNVSRMNSKVIFVGISRLIMLLLVLTPLLVFPQYKPIKITGSYKTDTVSYTITDTSREEYFTVGNDYRNVSFQFWYPTDQNGNMLDETYPLVIFSHGAFGYRMSNYSTFVELASHGYIVVSIDHTYHAFMTKQADGETIFADMDFVNSAMGVENGLINANELYELEQEWMKLRTDDMQFVLNYIKESVHKIDSDDIYNHIDIDKIGLMGHSLGGATSAEIGRQDSDVDAVIVIDGTMLGEIVGFEDGHEVISNEQYRIPLMNIYNDSHYNEAVKLKDSYPNMIAYQNAIDGYQVVIKGSGHMSFTDLPIISPFITSLLETSESVNVNPRYCIETTNDIILEFFNHYLKGTNETIQKERIY